MADAPYGRWADDPQPVVVSTPAAYSAQAQGPVRRAELHDATSGDLLGHVWTDDQQAAGFLDAGTPAGVRAGADVWGILRDAHEAGRPAAEVLDPALYLPAYRLVLA